jgi:hypothetical protein
MTLAVVMGVKIYFVIESQALWQVAKWLCALSRSHREIRI